MNPHNRKGVAAVVVIAVVAVLGLVGWITKPSLFPGASKRAAASTQATARVETAVNAQGASAAASVVKIGEANAVAPASPAKDFISKEVPIALGRLPAPDPQELLAAEKRRAAVMEGQLDEARRLYEAASKQSSQLQHERDAALAERHNVDLKLEQAAAAEHARTVQLMGASLFAVLALAAWAYLKIYHVSPATLGLMAAEIRAGENPIQALTHNLAPRHHARIARAAQLATPLKRHE